MIRPSLNPVSSSSDRWSKTENILMIIKKLNISMFRFNFGGVWKKKVGWKNELILIGSRKRKSVERKQCVPRWENKSSFFNRKRESVWRKMGGGMGELYLWHDKCIFTALFWSEMDQNGHQLGEAHTHTRFLTLTNIRTQTHSNINK